MEQETYKHYLRDLIYIIKEKIYEMNPKYDNDFEIGLKCGYEQVLDTIFNQMDTFQIDIKELGFNDFESFNNLNKQNNLKEE